MSNEELLEELYHKAYNKGFIDTFRLEIEKLRKTNSKKSHIEIAEQAYRNCKSKVC